MGPSLFGSVVYLCIYLFKDLSLQPPLLPDLPHHTIFLQSQSGLIKKLIINNNDDVISIINYILKIMVIIKAVNSFSYGSTNLINKK